MENTKRKELKKSSDLLDNKVKRTYTTCKLCEKRVLDYNNHEKIHRMNESYKCEVCSKVFHNVKYSNTHRKPHMAKKIECEMYSKRLAPGSYISHIKIHKGVKQYKCGHSLFNDSHLKRHIIGKHTDEKPFKCGTCLKTFTNLYHLQIHIDRKHVIEKIYKCDQCDKMFASESLFRSHIIFHGKHHQCEICGMQFSTTQQFMLHGQRVHGQTHNIPFRCEVCNKAFACRSLLMSHLMIHTGMKPFTCHVCGNIFRRIGDLKSHKRCHTGEKPYKWEICKKDFSRMDNLLYKHMKIHTGEKPYVCPLCFKYFNRSQNLKKHVKLHDHKEDKIEPTNILINV